MAAARVVRIAVTGGAGFIGRFVLDRLVAAGHDVIALGRTPIGMASVRDASCDLLDPTAVRSIFERERPTHLLHLAWVTQHDVFWDSPLNLPWVAASLELIRAFVECGGRRIVGAGSCAEYAWNGRPCNAAESELAPRHLYGASKDAFRRIVRAYASEAGVSFAWGRVFFVYGPGEPQRKLVSSSIVALSRGTLLRSREPERRLDFVYVEDVAAAFALLIEASFEGAANIASGRAHTVEDVLLRIGRHFGVDTIERVSAAAARPNVEAILAPKEAFGYEPRFNIDCGLESTIASFNLK